MGIKEFLINIPFLYFFNSRVEFNLKFFFQYFFELGFAFIILFYHFNFSLLNAFFNFFFYYFAFISIYEIGYYINDTISIKNEKNPTIRFKSYNSNLPILIFIFIRLSFFIMITLHLNIENNYSWWFFYIFLIIIFLMHNFFREVQYKLISFQMLAFLRFVAPFFLLIDFYLLFLIGNIISLTYIPYRTIGYLNQKKINQKIKRNLKFKFLIFSIPILFFIILILLDKFN